MAFWLKAQQGRDCIDACCYCSHLAVGRRHVLVLGCGGDSGGHDRLVPTGPFPSRPLCIKDVREAFLDTGERIVLQEGKPERYVAESLFQGVR